MRLTQNQFIEKSKKKYGDDAYNYSDVVYVTGMTPVTLTCKSGHTFSVKPSHHLIPNSKGGCTRCHSTEQSYTTDEFIAQCKETHGDLYDYSETVYKNKRTKVRIKCRKCHNIFEQLPHSHRKSGCPTCKGTKKLTQEDFIRKSKQVHGENKFDYSECVFVSTRGTVRLKCDKGHIFETVANNHLSGCGCFQCLMDSKKLTQDEFIEKAKKLHGEKFDYSECVYVNSTTKIKLKCDKGHWFETVAANHLNLKIVGCPVCFNENRKNRKGTDINFFRGKPTTLYYVKIDGVYKIGITTRTIKERFSGTINRRDFKVIKEWRYDNGADAYLQEQSYLEQFKEFRYITNDFLKYGGNRELFVSDILNLDHPSA